MNLPNKITVARLILTFLFVAVMTVDFPHAKTIGLLLFAIAAISDFFDGYYARKHNLVTNFGKLMDPLADKVLMCAGFVMLIGEGLIPAWVVIIILTREFLVTGLRLVASSAGHVLPAERLGKHKTGWQIGCVCYLLTSLAKEEVLFSWLGFLYEWKLTGVSVMGPILITIATLLTLISGVSYLWKNRMLLSDC